MEEYAKLNDSIYWHDGEGLYVNLFIAFGTELGGEGIPAAAGDEIPGAAGHDADW